MPLYHRPPVRGTAPFLVLLLLSAGRVGAQASPSAAAPVDLLDAAGRALAAYQANDVAGYLRYIEAADSLAPGHPHVLYHLARARALAGDSVGALRALERLAPLGASPALLADSAFARMRPMAAFRRVAASLTANAAPRVRSDTAFIVSDPDLIPESIAYDPADSAFYLSSLAKYKIVRRARGGAASDFAVLGAPGAGTVIGMKVDAPRRRLWAAVFARDSAAPSLRDGDAGRPAVHVYDLSTGRLLRRYTLADRRSPHFFNDLALTSSGDVYVTDAEGNAVYRVDGDLAAGRIERLTRAPARLTAPNGITVSPDDARLYVAHVEGISTWDPRRPGRATLLPQPPTAATVVIDGLYACRDALIAVQRLAGFDQVTRFRLSPAGDSITGAAALERQHPAYAQPTTGVMVGDTFYYIANSQVGRLGPGGKLAPAATPTRTVILRLPLGESCR